MNWSEAKRTIERDADTTRPFRLWNPALAGGNGGEFFHWRYYSHLRNAHLGALIECRWATIGTTIEVIDIRTHKLSGSYTRRAADIQFLGGDNIPAKLA